MDMMLEEFKTIFDRPEKVKKLREVILDLAVRGKLVEQDPNDEPASVLLERIKEEKDRLIREKKIKKEKALAEISEEEILFDLPEGWQMSRIGNLITLRGGKRIPKGFSVLEEKTDHIYIRITDMKNGSIKDYDLRYISDEVYDKIKSYIITKDDLYITIAGTIGDVGTVPEKFDNMNLTENAARIIPHLVDKFWLKIFIKSRMIQKMLLDKVNQMAQPKLALKRIQETIIPVPPLEEQKRIVEKVDSLMAFCDKLEESLEKKVHYGELAAKSVFNSVGNISSSEELEEMLRFIIKNFKDISLGDNAVKELKNCILQLAVQGKLVEQDPNDEPAEVLLERIREEKERLVKEKKIKKEKALPEISEEEKPFKIPDGWKWVRFLDVTICRDGQRVPVSKEEREKRKKIFDYYGASGVIDKIDSYIFDKPLLLIGEDGANLINRSTPIAFIAKGKYWVNNHAHVLDSNCEDVLRYLSININAIDLKPYVTGTAQPKMNQAKMNSILIALPPLEEQKRIVEKVDSLMLLCDELEKKIEEQKEYSNKLMESAIKEMLQSISNKEEIVSKEIEKEDEISVTIS